MKPAIMHLERTLGPISVGWSESPDRSPLPFQVVKFDNIPNIDANAYTTLGLSAHELVSKTSGKVIRQELLMLLPEKVRPDKAVAQIVQVGMMAIQAHRALLRGEVFGPISKLSPRSEMTDLYITAPSYFAENFATFSDATGTAVISWLIPIGEHEANYVHYHGWESFEDALVAHDPDLVNVERTQMRLH